MMFLDIARAVAVPLGKRKDWLRNFIKPKNIPQNYKAFRRSLRRIYRVPLGLDNSPAPTRQEIEKAISADSNDINLDNNLEVALALFDYLATQEFLSFEHDQKQLRIGPHRKISFDLDFYIARGGTAVFQYPYPRATRLTHPQIRIMLHLIREVYCIDDFEHADVELVELSRATGTKGRQSLCYSISDFEPFEVGELVREIQTVHNLLLEIDAEQGT